MSKEKSEKSGKSKKKAAALTEAPVTAAVVKGDKKKRSDKAPKADKAVKAPKAERADKKEVVKEAQIAVTISVTDLEKLAKKAAKLYVAPKKADKKIIAAGIEALFNSAVAELVTRNFAKSVKNAKLPFVATQVKEVLTATTLTATPVVSGKVKKSDKAVKASKADKKVEAAPKADKKAEKAIKKADKKADKKSEAAVVAPAEKAKKKKKNKK